MKFKQYSPINLKSNNRELILKKCLIKCKNSKTVVYFILHFKFTLTTRQ